MENTGNQKYDKLTTDGSKKLKLRHQSAKGSPSGSIIFVHGICHGAWCFEKFMDYFSDNGYECFSLNLRGHGDNIRKGLTFATLSQYRNDIIECVNYCSKYLHEKGITEKPFLLGHSMRCIILTVSNTYIDAGGYAHERLQQNHSPLLPPIRGGRGQGRRREQQHTEPEEISGKLCQTVKIDQYPALH
ncbi:alpha/beta fold hydrolase [bacterium 1XD8-76]|nr:alpha/beta fold hydrolase [bacterium 1XD8-76]